MQLHKSIETNLFNDLSDQEQEVVAGGVSYSGIAPGGYLVFKNGPGGGGFSYTSAYTGKTYTYKWPA